MPCNDGLMAAAVCSWSPQQYGSFKRICQTLNILDPRTTPDKNQPPLSRQLYDMINGVAQMVPPLGNSVRILPYTHGTTTLDCAELKDQHVLFIDCRPKDEDIDRVAKACASITIWDHHVFADPKMNSEIYQQRIRSVNPESSFYYSKDHCGSMIAWLQRFPSNDVPPLLSSVDRYDRGVGTKEDVHIAEALKCLTKSVDDRHLFLYLLAASHDASVMNCLQKWGKCIIQEREATVETLVNQTVQFTRDNASRLTIAQAQAADAISAGHTLHVLRAWYPHVDIYAAYYHQVVFKDEYKTTYKTVFSFRTRTGVNLTEFSSRIGKQFGGSGGGHREASGMQIPGLHIQVPGTEFIMNPTFAYCLITTLAYFAFVLGSLFVNHPRHVVMTTIATMCHVCIMFVLFKHTIKYYYTQASRMLMRRMDTAN
jgi:hypothetical protein